ncbi:pectin lyase-like protein [Eremomyces bilateralis CBS 781.70]|uniref:pectinesterase n=1 Tax=Eremomyces bilateralis CBS 781.70 TaxID=1392243 RepID=A0A6G1G7Y4_9PEZI|nr:pectin lyase-like protein [Eremomyces bilateralis CBS 781.70]KAF1814031.1 pectin lyase-like protein [Eremomyces bilateralis CBS 781.70]
MKIGTITAICLALGHATAQDAYGHPPPTKPQNKVKTFPPQGDFTVNPDTHLVLEFDSPPEIGNSGLIRIYDVFANKVVDTLNMSIPASPNPSGRAPTADGSTTSPPPADPNDKNPYQVNIIGGLDFYFFPIIVRGNVATIYPHNNVLKYGRVYKVTVDPEVLKASKGTFDGFSDRSPWIFSTKLFPPSLESKRLTVSNDGRGDFNTVQGAVDFVPENYAQRVNIYVKDGNYEELIFIQNKRNLVIRGQSREKTIVGYPNNSAFNPSRGGPSRRPAFTLYNTTDIQLSSLTINNYFIGQAEALLVRGERIIIDHVSLNGSGDAFTTYGTIYFVDSSIIGHGDTVLGYAAVYYLRSRIDSIGPFTWTRTPEGSHGNVFVNSTLAAIDEPLPWTVTPENPAGQKVKSVYGRLPNNGKGNTTANFPFAEMVLINTKTSGVSAEGWDPIQGPPFDTSNVKFWEYATTDLEGVLVDTSKRHNVSRQLKLPKDAQIIQDYSNPAFVLNGWTPVVVTE